MILQALVKEYENLRTEGKVPERGWSSAKVSFALELNLAGEIIGVKRLKLEEIRGKKTVEIPQIMVVPEQIKRAVNITSQFLCDNSSYYLGVDNKGKAERSRKCFDAAGELHQQILTSGTSDAAIAVCNFFKMWQPEQANEYVILKPYLEEIKAGANLVFIVNGEYVHENEEIRTLWQNAPANDAVIMQCLVTGKMSPIARLHPSIKGVRGAQAAGASLVSFNAPAYESYGRNEAQGLNAPVSEYAAFAYGTVLNQFLNDKKHARVVGDTTVIYWAEKNNEACQNLIQGMFFGGDDTISDELLEGIFTRVSQNQDIDFSGIKLTYDNPFYVLGLAPNAARLSIRFFLRSTFGDILKNLSEHAERMKIVKPTFEKFSYIPIDRILQETVSKNAKDKSASPLLSGALMQAILQNKPYPVSLLQNIMLRIRAEEGQDKINYRRAAILKACYLKKNNCLNSRRDLEVLNEEFCEVEYVLGRLFAVLEHIQQTANPNINATIKDRYFDAACATPAKVFPILQKLASHHLRKLEIPKKVYFEKQLTHIIGKIEMSRQPLPRFLSLEKQSVFILGYYHQVQKRYEKKEEK